MLKRNGQAPPPPPSPARGEGEKPFSPALGEGELLFSPARGEGGARRGRGQSDLPFRLHPWAGLAIRGQMKCLNDGCPRIAKPSHG